MGNSGHKGQHSNNDSHWMHWQPPSLAASDNGSADPASICSADCQLDLLSSRWVVVQEVITLQEQAASASSSGQDRSVVQLRNSSLRCVCLPGLNMAVEANSRCITAMVTACIDSRFQQLQVIKRLQSC